MRLAASQMPDAFAETVDDRHFVRRHAVAQLLFWSGFYYIFPALLGRIAQSSGWSPIGLSGALTVAFLVWAALSPLAGCGIDRGLGGSLMRGGGLLGAGLLLLLSVTRSELVAYSCLALLGLPMAMTLYDPCFALMLRRFGSRPEAARAITTVTLVAGFATLLTFPVVAGLLVANIDWRTIMALFALAVVLAVFILPKTSPAEDRQDRVAEIATTQTGPRLLAVAIAFALVNFAHTVLLFQVPVLLVETWPEGTAVLLPMILGPAQVAGRLLWGRLQGRLPLGRSVFWLFSALLIPPAMLATGAGIPMVVLVALCLQGAGYGIQTIVRPLLVVNWLPGNVGAKLGLVAMVGLILMALGPIAGITASELGGATAVMALAGGSVALALCCLAVVSRSLANREARQ